MNNEEKILALLEKMDNRLSNVEKSQQEMRGEMNEMRGEINQINTRLSNVEKSQQEMRGEIRAIDQRVTKLELNQENIIIPQIKLLAEGQMTLQEQIRKLSVVDALQADVATLKAAVGFLSSELKELKEKIA